VTFRTVDSAVDCDHGNMRRARHTARLLVLVALIAVLPAAMKDATPIVGLNHITLVPDSATFAAIANSSFLRDTFAMGDSSANNSERVALFGRSTYIEFVRPTPGARPWSGGLAFGTDESGALLALAKRLTSEVGPLQLDSVSRRRDSTEVPWLYRLAMRADRADSTLDIRDVEYHPQFVQRWFGKSAPTKTSVARADVLAMHNPRSRSVSAAFRFVDVVGIKIAAPPESAEIFLAHCRGVGWRVQQAAEGKACVGPGVRLFIVPSAQASERGIVAFTMRVRPSVKLAPARRSFGRSTLSISRTGFATWEFSRAKL